MTYTTFWLMVCGACLIMEVFTVGFLLFFPGVGAFLAFLAALIGLNFFTQVTIFAVSTVLMIFFARPLIDRLFKTNAIPPMHSENLVGKTGTVLKEISGDHSMGQVKVSGEVWSAISFTKEIIEKDKKVTIKAIKGVKLLVEEKKNKEESL